MTTRRVRRRGKEYANLKLIRIIFRGGSLVREPDVVEVEVMARVRGYAMVRRKGCMPFVANEKDLTPIEKLSD